MVETQLNGVSLGASVDGVTTWAHDLDISIGLDGITVGGGESTEPNVLPWTSVRRLSPGYKLAFPDGRHATELEVVLYDRELSFLVPADQLSPAQVSELIRIANAGASDSRAVPAGSPSPQDVFSGPTPLKRRDDAVVIGSRPVQPAKSRRRPLLLTGAGTICIAIVVVAVLLLTGGSTPKAAANTRTNRVSRSRSTTTTAALSPAPAQELSGPPASTNPATATAEVLIRASELKGWTSQGGAGEEYPGQPQAIAQSSTGDPFLPAASSLVEPSFGVLQQCSNLPLDHLQLFTGNYYAGGPPTWNSAYYSPSDENATQSTPTPQLFSIASVVATPADQESDLQAVAASSFPSCLSSFFLSYLRAEFGQEGGTVDDVKVTPYAVTPVTGVETLEFELNAQLVASGDVVGFRARFAFMGAGRMEEMVSGYDSTNEPIPSGTWSALVATLQHQMVVTATPS